MANENQDLQDEMNRLRESMQRGGEGLKDFDDSLRKADVGLDAFGAATKQGAKDIGKNLGGLALQLGQGDSNFKNLNKIVDVTSDALAGMAKAIPFAGDAVAAGLKAAAEGAKFMLDQMDQTTKAFNDLGKVGALTASGMSGLQQQFLKSGLSLQNYTKIVGENSQALARMGGMVEGGAEAFTDITEHFTNLAGGGDDALRKLGLNSEQIGQSTAAFVTQQTRLGRSQQMSTNDLIAGTKAYSLELDALQKVTGLSREAIQKQQDAALSEARFRANYEEQVAAGNEKGAKALMALQTQMTTIGPELGQATRDLASGAANTDSARKLMASTGGAAQDIIERLKTGQIDQFQAAKELQEASRRMGDAARTNAKYVDKANSSYIDFAQQADLNNATILADGKIVKKVQDDQLKGTDKLTDQTIDAQKNMEKFNREIQDLGFKFLPDAATAVKKTTEAMKGLVEFINDKVLGRGTGTGEPGPSASGSTGTGMDMGGAEIMDAAGGGVPKADVDKILATIRQRESGGDYGVKAKGSSASGAYQFIDKTWQSLTKQANVGTEFKTAKEAPKEIQDAIAKLHVENLLKQAGGDVSKVPLGWYTGNIQGKMSPEALAANQGLTPEMYQQKWMGDYAKISGGPKASAANGAIISGPTSGYRPNLTMHGTEAVVPLNSPQAQQTPGLGMNSDLMQQQLDRLTEMVSVMKNQLDVSKRLMQYSS